jgi:hypothetical protein
MRRQPAPYFTLDSDTAPVNVDFATGSKSTLAMNVELHARLVRDVVLP